VADPPQSNKSFNLYFFSKVYLFIIVLFSFIIFNEEG